MFLSSSPYASLLAVLSQAPLLSAIRILVAQSTGQNSAWTHSSFLQRPDGIPISSILRSLLPSYSLLKTKLPYLASLELDAFSDIAPLLKLTPNLIRLKMTLPNGFAQYTNMQFLDSLRHIPKLRSLVYSAGSLELRLPEINGASDNDDFLDESGPGGNAGLLKGIALALPRLEQLDLQSRWFGENEILFSSQSEAISPEVSFFSYCTISVLLFVRPPLIPDNQVLMHVFSADCRI